MPKHPGSSHAKPKRKKISDKKLKAELKRDPKLFKRTRVDEIPRGIPKEVSPAIARAAEAKRAKKAVKGRKKPKKK